MSKHRKAKPTLKPEALAWLAEKLPADAWQKVLDLHRVSMPALFEYVRRIADDVYYQEFVDLNEPEIAAERRKKEAERKEAERQQSLTIYPGTLPKVSEEQRILDGLQGKGWHATTLTEREREEAATQAEEERSGTRAIPPAEFDPL